MAKYRSLISSKTCGDLSRMPFCDTSIRPIVCIADPTGIARWLIASMHGDRLYGLGDFGDGQPGLSIMSHEFLSILRGPGGQRLACRERPKFRSFATWTLDVWAVVARRTGSIVAAEIELAKAGQALALSRFQSSGE